MRIFKKKSLSTYRIGNFILACLHVEMFFKEINSIVSILYCIYIVICLIQFEDVVKWHLAVKHLSLIYIFIRAIIVQYSNLSLIQGIILFAWLPLNHYMVFSKDKIRSQLSTTIDNNPQSKKLSHDFSKCQENTPQLGRDAICDYEDQSSSLFPQSNQHIQQLQQMTFQFQNPFMGSQRKDGLTNIQNQFSQSNVIQMQKSFENNEIYDIMNLLPFGICLINNKYEVITHNIKLQHYLKLTDNEERNILLNLDSLLESAETFESKSIYKPSSHQSQRYSKRLLSRQFSQISKYYNNEKDMTSIIQESGTISNANKNFTYIPNSINPAREEILSNKSRLKNIETIFKNFQSLKSQQFNNQENSFQSKEQNIQIYKKHQQIGQKNYYLRIKIYELFEESKVQYWFVIENITNKEELRILNLRYKFQQLLLNSLCHELRTPMNNTLSQLNVLKSLIDPDIVYKHLIPAIISAKKLMFQLNDILDFAQIQCENFQLQISTFELQEIFDTLKMLFEQECLDKKIKFNCNGNEDLSIRSDKDRILRILINLIDNSIKFTKIGGTIILSVSQINQQIFFQVEDSGIGIPEKYLTKIRNDKDFTQQQFNNSQNKLGLGLRTSIQISKYLCSDNQLFIESQVGKFTKISFKIDGLVKRQKQMKLPSFEMNLNNSIHCNCIKILNVDDVPFNHRAVQALLKCSEINLNIDMDSAFDGDDALEKVKFKMQSDCCKVYKIIIMDIEMPKKNGYQSAKEITSLLKKNKLEGQSVIVMSSAYSGKENINIAKENGITETMPKPIEIKQLKQLLEKYLF